MPWPDTLDPIVHVVNGGAVVHHIDLGRLGCVPHRHLVDVKRARVRPVVEQRLQARPAPPPAPTAGHVVETGEQKEVLLGAVDDPGHARLREEVGPRGGGGAGHRGDELGRVGVGAEAAAAVLSRLL
eukprot:scaffold500688_cov31-Prasinocladus_malaysianus.AAC.1